MKPLSFFVFVVVLYSCSTQSTSAPELLTANSFSDELKSSPDIILLDVRTPEEVQNGFIVGAKNINYNSENFLSSLDSLDRSKKYFVYCGSGKRSAKTQELMRENGFKQVTGLDGGFKAWMANGLPVQKP